jgi:multidrug efflux system membrane fusion protein
MSQQRALADDEPKRRRWWFWAGTLMLLLVVYRTAGGFGRAHQQSIEASAGVHTQSVLVSTAAAKRGDLKIYLNELGTVTPLKTVIVHSRVDGELVDVHFKAGDTVKEGDLLAEIDPRPYQIQLTQAEAQMARDRAWLVNAQGQLARYKELFSQNVISRQELDTQQSQADQYAAAVKNDQALIDSARLNLFYCRITSPINGRIGSRLIDPGNIVHAFDTQGLMVITQLQPVAVIFSIPQDDLPRFTKATMGMSQLPVDAYAPGFNNRIATGTVFPPDDEIDQATRSLKLRASFRNEDSVLLPNQSVNTRLLVDTMHDAVLIPAPAVQRNAQGDFVYVVKPDQTVAMRSVDVGATQGDTSAISRGLNPGELVVVDGTDKLHRGSRVSVQLAEDSTNFPSHPASGRAR